MGNMLIGIRFRSITNGYATRSIVEQKPRNHLINNDIPNTFGRKYVWKPRGN